MPLLDFESESRSSGRAIYSKHARRPLTLILGIGALAGIIGLGSSLAANIDINTGSPIEFGQGVAQTTSCDNEITVTPESNFVNSNQAGGFTFNRVRISGIDSSTGHCNGKNFTIRAYGDAGQIPLFTYSINGGSTSEEIDSVVIHNDAGIFTSNSLGLESDDVIDDADNADPKTTGFTVDFASASNSIVRTPIALAKDVKTITVETSQVGQLSGVHIGVGALAGIVEYSNGATIFESHCLPHGGIDYCLTAISAKVFVNAIKSESYPISNNPILDGVANSAQALQTSVAFTFNPTNPEGQEWSMRAYSFDGLPLGDSVEGSIFNYSNGIGIFQLNGPPYIVLFSTKGDLDFNGVPVLDHSLETGWIGRVDIYDALATRYWNQFSDFLNYTRYTE
jgi:hypothetical protein